MRVAATGGTPETLITAQNALIAANPEVLADSGAVLFTQYPIGFGSRPQIVVQQPGTAARVVVANEGMDARYLADTSAATGTSPTSSSPRKIRMRPVSVTWPIAVPCTSHLEHTASTSSSRSGSQTRASAPATPRP